MNNKIEIRNLKYNLPPTLIGQILKCQEEMDEFIKGILKGDSDNSLEEFHDVIQAMLGALQLNNIPINDVVDSQNEHYKKLSKRGWKYID